MIRPPQWIWAACTFLLGLPHATAMAAPVGSSRFFSDIRPQIGVEELGSGFCSPVAVTFSFDNTSTAGGGPVPVTAATLTAKIPSQWVLEISEGDIQATKGSVSLSHDGETYTLVNTLGNMAANEVASMVVSVRLSGFASHISLYAEVDSPTFDPVEANNTLSVDYTFGFSPFGTPVVTPVSNFDLVPEDPFNLFTDNPAQPASARFRFQYDEEGCDVVFRNGFWHMAFPTGLGSIEVDETEGGEVEVADDNGMTHVRVHFDELEPGGTLGATVRFPNLPQNGLFEYLFGLTADEIEDGLLFGGTIEIATPLLPDLTVTKTASLPDSIQIPMLDSLVYTLKIRNIGLATAENVTLRDPLPSPQFVHFSSGSSKGTCTATDGIVSCTIGELAAGDSATVTIKVVAHFPGAAINQAEVSTTSEESNVENNFSNTVIHFPVTAERRADLSVHVNVFAPDSIRTGALMAFRAALINHGTHTANDVTFILNFDQPLTIQSLSVVAKDAVNCPEAATLGTTIAVTCTVPNLSVREPVHLVLVARAAANLGNAVGIGLAGIAAASSPSDPDLSNNAHQTSVPISRFMPVPPIPPLPPIIPTPTPPDAEWADVEVSKAVILPAGPAFVPCLGLFASAYLVGQPIFHRFIVRNKGRDIARNVTFQDDVLLSSTFMDYHFLSLPVAMQHDCQLAPAPFGLGFSTLTCDLGDLAPGEERTFSIRADAALPGNNIPNFAAAFSQTFDPNPWNNFSVNMVDIFELSCPAEYGVDMSVTITDMSAAKRTTETDSLRTVRVRFSNEGNAPAYYNTYSDTLPSAMRFVELSPLDPTDTSLNCTVEEIDDGGQPRNLIKCYWFRHDPDEEKVIDIVARIERMGRLDWASYVRSATFDGNPSNNKDTLSLFNLLGTPLEPDAASELPHQSQLFPNYPNPFNPVTQIPFWLAAPAHVELAVYSLDGRLVRTLLQQKLAAGEYRVPFDAKGLGSGVYLYRLRAGNVVTTRKMVVLR